MPVGFVTDNYRSLLAAEGGYCFGGAEQAVTYAVGSSATAPAGSLGLFVMHAKSDLLTAVESHAVKMARGINPTGRILEVSYDEADRLAELTWDRACHVWTVTVSALTVVAERTPSDLVGIDASAYLP